MIFFIVFQLLESKLKKWNYMHALSFRLQIEASDQPISKAQFQLFNFLAFQKLKVAQLKLRLKKIWVSHQSLIFHFCSLCRWLLVEMSAADRDNGIEKNQIRLREQTI